MRRLLIALILAATAALVVGVLPERHETAREAGETPAQRASLLAARAAVATQDTAPSARIAGGRP